MVNYIKVSLQAEETISFLRTEGFDSDDEVDIIYSRKYGCKMRWMWAPKGIDDDDLAEVMEGAQGILDVEIEEKGIFTSSDHPYRHLVLKSRKYRRSSV